MLQVIQGKDVSCFSGLCCLISTVETTYSEGKKHSDMYRKSPDVIYFFVYEYVMVVFCSILFCLILSHMAVFCGRESCQARTLPF